MCIFHLPTLDWLVYIQTNYLTHHLMHIGVVTLAPIVLKIMQRFVLVSS